MKQAEMADILNSTQMVIATEITRMLQYLTRDASWTGCFDVAINVDGFLERMKKSKLVGRLFEADDPEWEQAVRQLVVSVALQWNIPVTDTPRED